MRQASKIVIGLLLVAGVTACQTDDSYTGYALFEYVVSDKAGGTLIGSGPITLSPRVQAKFEEYKSYWDKRSPHSNCLEPIEQFIPGAGGQDHRPKRGDGAFAVTLDGQHASWVNCPQRMSCMQCWIWKHLAYPGGSELGAIEGCEKQSGRTCKIYSIDGRVVWKGATTVRGLRIGQANE